VSFTVVFFHAHPDDEAFYTGGTMARLAAEGNRVVLVTATLGEAGLADEGLTADKPLGEVRERELMKAASVLGCSRLVQLGYEDSGMAANSRSAFANLDPHEPASRLADVLREERADAVVTYDENGGYGHPDHVQVHRVGRIAAREAETPMELQATIDRDALRKALSLATLARLSVEGFRSDRFEHAYSPRERITHRVGVGRYLNQKRAALQAHRSQASGGDGKRTAMVLLSLPAPVFRVVMAREWFIEAGRHRERRPLDDVLASLRP
jgi:LmbE family N-acetylglucosaminyl deacetylase